MMLSIVKIFVAIYICGGYIYITTTDFGQNPFDQSNFAARMELVFKRNIRNIDHTVFSPLTKVYEVVLKVRQVRSSFYKQSEVHSRLYSTIPPSLRKTR